MNTKILLTSIAVGLSALIIVNVSLAANNVKEITPQPKSMTSYDAPNEIKDLELVSEPAIFEQVAVEAPMQSQETVSIAELIVKTNEEIAAQYPNLTSTDQQKLCFSKLLAMFPDRFTESVREKNIKALTAFGSSCSTGVLNQTAVINSFGANGAFFDSDMAKAQY